jgi:hypothetical protein
MYSTFYGPELEQRDDILTWSSDLNCAGAQRALVDDLQICLRGWKYTIMFL